MLNKKRTETLLSYIRDGRDMTRHDKLSLIVWLSVPSILAQITNVMMFFIDASMVGHLGEKASASIGLVESTTWLLGSLMGAVSMGFSVQVAHFIGANDFAKARQVLRHALVCGLMFSVLLGLTGAAVSGPLPLWLGGGTDIQADASLYFLLISASLPFMLLFHLSSAMLRSSGDMHLPSIMSVVLCVMDVAFNYLFIYVFALGVLGAALGTTVSYVATALPTLYLLIARNKFLSFRLDTEPFRWVWAYVRNAAKISGPIALQSILMGGAQIVSTYIVAPLGNVAIAANSFAITVESLCYMPGYGIGDAAATLVGQTFGAGRKQLCRQFAFMSVGLGMAVMTVMGAAMWVFAPEMMALLTPVDAIRDLGASVLRIEAWAEPFFAASIVAYEACVGAGDTLKPAIINLVSMWCVRLTTAALLAQHYGLKGVWTAMAVELTFRGCMFLLRLLRGGWLDKIAPKEPEGTPQAAA